MRHDFYVYALFRENGLPFYVGKGFRERWSVHESQARKGRIGHRFSIIRGMQAHGIEIPKIKLHERLTEATAHDYEVALIAAIGRKPNGPLVNETDGGEGSTGFEFKPENVRRGYTHSPEVRAKIAAKRVGVKRAPEVTERIVAKLRGKQHDPQRTEQRIAKIRGRKYTDEHVANMAASLRGRKLSSEHANKSSVFLRALSDDPVMRAKREQARVEALRKPEVRAANAARCRAMWSDPVMRAKILEKRRATLAQANVARL